MNDGIVSLKEFISIPDDWDHSKIDFSEIGSSIFYESIRFFLIVLTILFSFLVSAILIVFSFTPNIEPCLFFLIFIGGSLVVWSLIDGTKRIGKYVSKLLLDEKMSQKSTKKDTIKRWCSEYPEVNEYAKSVFQTGRKYLSKYEVEKIQSYLDEKYPENNLDFIQS